MTWVERLTYMFGPMSMSAWVDDFPDSIPEGRAGRVMRADLEIDPDSDTSVSVVRPQWP